MQRLLCDARRKQLYVGNDCNELDLRNAAGAVLVSVSLNFGLSMRVPLLLVILTHFNAIALKIGSNEDLDFYHSAEDFKTIFREIAYTKPSKAR